MEQGIENFDLDIQNSQDNLELSDNNIIEDIEQNIGNFDLNIDSNENDLELLNNEIAETIDENIDNLDLNIDNTSEDLQLFNDNFEESQTANFEIEANVNNKLQNEDEIKIVDFSKFNYNIENNSLDFDPSEITNDILEIDKKYPMYKIIDVFNLKYKKHFSVEEIASELNMETEIVNESLNEILSII